MRVMAKITIPVESGGDGTIGKIVQRTAERWKPEAMYFGNFQGQRTAFIVFDMPDSSDLPTAADSNGDSNSQRLAAAIGSTQGHSHVAWRLGICPA